MAFMTIHERYILLFSLQKLIIMGFFNAFGLGDLLTSATSLFGGFFSSKGVRDTNKTNLQIARETNQANRDNQEYQNEWNLNMWNKQNEYNSPVAQRQRLEAAGLNPIFNGLDGAGNAGALQSAPFTAVNGAPMLNEGAPMGESIANLGKTLAEIELMRSQAKKNNEDAKGQNIANQIAEATKPVLIEDANVKLALDKVMVEKTREEKLKIGKEVQVFSEQVEKIKSDVSLNGVMKEYYNSMKDKVDQERDYQKDENTRAMWRYADDLLFKWIGVFQRQEEIDLNAALSWEETQYLIAQTEEKRQQIYDRMSESFQRFLEREDSSYTRKQGYVQGQENIKLTSENAKYVGKKGDWYEYEMVINGIKTAVMVGTLLF